MKPPTIYYIVITLPETDIATKMDAWKTGFLLGWRPGRCYVSFRECIYTFGPPKALNQTTWKMFFYALKIWVIKPGFPWHICMYVMERLWRSRIYYCVGESPKLTANASQFWVGQGLIPICFLVFPCLNDPKNPDILLHTDQILFGVYFPYRIHGTKRISIFTYLDDGFKYVYILFSPLLGEMIQFHKYFFKWVGSTTNQLYIGLIFMGSMSSNISGT